MTLAVSKALEEGAAAVLCASTGNTAASAAAYAARAGLPAVVLTPQGAVAGAKLAQTRMLGAIVLEVRGDFDAALAAAQELAGRGTHVLVNSLNPYRRAGQKTAVLEIVEELGGAPDAFVLPYGGGGNTSAYAQALAELGLDTPIVSVEAEKRRETLATAIRIGDPVHAEAVRAAGARVIHVDDDEIVSAWRTARVGGGALLRAVLGRRPRSGAPRRRRRRPARRHDHRARPQGPGDRRPARAPARRGRSRSRRHRLGFPSRPRSGLTPSSHRRWVLHGTRWARGGVRNPGVERHPRREPSSKRKASSSSPRRGTRASATSPHSATRTATRSSCVAGTQREFRLLAPPFRRSGRQTGHAGFPQHAWGSSRCVAGGSPRRCPYTREFRRGHVYRRLSR